MGIDLDDEILQDFLIEAGEIIEKLGEQLVELEQSPNDLDLLNAIFRSFHTVKGGAGFLNITALVDVCHKAEDVFNVLRQGERRVDPDLMDAILQVVDVVNGMFEMIRAGDDPADADPELLRRLAALARPESDAPPDAPPPPSVAPTAPAFEPQQSAPPAMPEPREPAASQDITPEEFEALLDVLNPLDGGEATAPDVETGDEITEEEFERLLDQLHGPGKHKPMPAPVVAPTVASDEITDDEFEQLLDQLHGQGKQFGALASPSAAPNGQSTPAPGAESSSADLITEDEFESLLDNLHGKGKHSGAPGAPPKAATKPTPPPAARPAPVAKSPPPVPASAEERRAAPSPANKPAAAGSGENTVRVDTERLDEIMNMVGELVLVRNRFQTLKSALNDEHIAKAVAYLDVVTSDLQVAVMKTRMQPIKKVFGRFPRVVRDLARSLNKEVRLELRGEETDLDKNLVEALADPLVHLVRNSVDHGVEMPDDRVAAGKPREGVVILTASQEGNHIELTISDDGKGMDAEVLRRKAVEKGLMDDETASRLDEKECFNLIFLPGFSTKSEISDISGRGVGMDVVKTRIAQMNGTVEIESAKGRGSRIIIKLPLTLAIMPTLMVKLDNQPFALPLASVVEILDLDLKRTNVVDGRMVIMVRERAMPLFYLKDWLIKGHRYRTKDGEQRGHVVVVNVGGQRIGFVVDHLVGQEEVVIKALGAKLKGVAGLAGATITGDGMIALILDMPGLMRRYAA